MEFTCHPTTGLDDDLVGKAARITVSQFVQEGEELLAMLKACSCGPDKDIADMLLMFPAVHAIAKWQIVKKTQQDVETFRLLGNAMQEVAIVKDSSSLGEKAKAQIAKLHEFLSAAGKLEFSVLLGAAKDESETLKSLHVDWESLLYLPDGSEKPSAMLLESSSARSAMKEFCKLKNEKDNILKHINGLSSKKVVLDSIRSLKTGDIGNAPEDEIAMKDIKETVSKAQRLIAVRSSLVALLRGDAEQADGMVKQIGKNPLKVPDNIVEKLKFIALDVDTGNTGGDGDKGDHKHGKATDEDASTKQSAPKVPKMATHEAASAPEPKNADQGPGMSTKEAASASAPSTAGTSAKRGRGRGRGAPVSQNPLAKFASTNGKKA